MPLQYRETGHSNRALLIAGIVAFILQVAIAPQISILGGRINFMAAFAGAVALRGEVNQAVWVGFIAGACYDFTASVPAGLMMLILTIGSFVLAGMASGSGGGLSARSFQLLAITLILECVINGLALVIMGSEGSLVTGVLVHGLVSGVLSSAVGALFVLALGGGSNANRGFSARGKGTRYKAPR